MTTLKDIIKDTLHELNVADAEDLSNLDDITTEVHQAIINYLSL